MSTSRSCGARHDVLRRSALNRNVAQERCGCSTVCGCRASCSSCARNVGVIAGSSVVGVRSVSFMVVLVAVLLYCFDYCDGIVIAYEPVSRLQPGAQVLLIAITCVLPPFYPLR